MALQKKHTVNVYGRELTFDVAYAQIVKVSGDKTLVTIDVAIYDDANKQHIIEYKTYKFVPSDDDDAPRWDKQGYEYIKTLPEFVGAIDV